MYRKITPQALWGVSLNLNLRNPWFGWVLRMGVTSWIKNGTKPKNAISHSNVIREIYVIRDEGLVSNLIGNWSAIFVVITPRQFCMEAERNTNIIYQYIVQMRICFQLNWECILVPVISHFVSQYVRTTQLTMAIISSIHAPFAGLHVYTRDNTSWSLPTKRKHHHLNIHKAGGPHGPC
jgi:hypothetical protein